MQNVFFSSDGMNIEYIESGKGARMLLLFDCQGSEQERNTIFGILETSFHVFAPNRRDWVYGGINGECYSVYQECFELIEFMEENKIQNIFGQGFGAVIAMHLALRYPVKKMVLFETYLTRFMNLNWLPKYNRQMQKGDYLGAGVTFLKRTGEIKWFIPSAVLKLFIWFLFHVSIFPVNKEEQLKVKIIRYEDTRINKIWTKNINERKRMNFIRELKQICLPIMAAVQSEAELDGLAGVATEALILCHCGSKGYVFKSADYLTKHISGSRKIIVNLTGEHKGGTDSAGYPDFLRSITEFINKEGIKNV